MAQQPLMGQGLIIGASRSRPDTPQSLGLLWKSDKADTRPLPDNTKDSL